MKSIIRKSECFSDNILSDIASKLDSSYFDLGYGNISPSLIKYDIKCSKLLKNEINYSCSNGNDDLISLIKKFIDKKYKNSIEKENILITNGTTNALFLLFLHLRNRGKNRVFMQNPSYDAAINITRSLGFSLSNFDSTEKIETQKKIENVYYLMFKSQNPTGKDFSANDEIITKNKILEKSILIDDDAYSLLSNNKDYYLPFENDNYIFLGSFSKYIFPALRMGYLIASPEVVKELTLYQKYYNSHPNKLSQALLTQYLLSGKIYDEIEHKKTIIKKRRKIFENTISKEILKKIKYISSRFYYCIEFNKNTNANLIFMELIEKKIFVIPGEIYSIDNEKNSLRICISNIETADIEKAAIPAWPKNAVQSVA